MLQLLSYRCAPTGAQRPVRPRHVAPKWRARPGVEDLEGRQLLRGGLLSAGFAPPLIETLRAASTELVPTVSTRTNVVGAVSGIVFQTESGPSTFRRLGPNLLASRPLTLMIFANPGQNGYEGEIHAQERILRLGQTSTFKGHYLQTFKGDVVINGVRYSGTLTQAVRVWGPLNPNLPLDDPMQGARSLMGTFRNIGGTGQLKNMRGHGTLEWPGGMVPPSYQGVVRL